MTDLNSDQYGISVATGASVDKVPVNEWGVVARRYYFSATTTGSFGSAVSNILNLVTIPGSPTGIRIFIEETKLACSIDPGGKACLGLGSYTNINGSSISANFSALAVLTGSAFDQEVSMFEFFSVVVSYGASVGGAGDRTLLVDSKGPVTVILGGSTATSVFSVAAGTVFRGWIVAG